MTESVLKVDQVYKSFNGQAVVSNLSLNVEAGEIVCLLGPSGSGKTTLLRLVAGLEKVDAGQISIQDKVVASHRIHVEPEFRGLGMVFQDYALWPHLKVLDNVGLPLREKGDRKWRTKAENALSLVGLTGFESRYSFELSGGQQQRVALARAIAARPKILLFDEPLSNLDAKLKGELREVIANSVREAGLAALYITHDQEEALFLADRLGVINQGGLVQMDTPEKVYLQPNNAFVAHFTSASGPFPVKIEDDFVIWKDQRVEKPLNLEISQRSGFLYLRSNGLCLAKKQTANTIQAEVLVSGFAGNGWWTLLQMPEGRLYQRLDQRWPSGQQLSFTVNWDAAFLFDSPHEVGNMRLGKIPIQNVLTSRKEIGDLK